MQKESHQQFVPDQKWREHSGALFVVAHPDDEILIGWGVMQMLVEAGIPVTVLLATLGEKGKNDGQQLPPKEMAALREREFTAAMEALGVDGVVLDPAMPDGEITSRQDELNRAVTKFVRDGEYDVIFSFAPGERTFMFDHDDHHAVSAASVIASEKADVPGLFIESSTPLGFRPSLLGWTTNPAMGARHQLFEVSLSDDSIAERNSFLAEYYPSQFPDNKRRSWEPVFDRISRGDNKESHRHLFFQIR
jgi:LmbE family N-acetylglucosaminyl deacetylase